MNDPKKTEGEDRRGTNEPWKQPGQSSQQPGQKSPPKPEHKPPPLPDHKGQ